MFYGNGKEAKKSAPTNNQTTSLFSKGSTFRGSIETSTDLRVDGKVIGKIIAKAKVVSGEDSTIEGPIEGTRVEVMGKVKGNIHVTEILVLKPTAVIEGNIYATDMVVENGALINGKCQVGPGQKNYMSVINNTDNEALPKTEQYPETGS